MVDWNETLILLKEMDDKVNKELARMYFDSCLSSLPAKFEVEENPVPEIRLFTYKILTPKKNMIFLDLGEPKGGCPRCHHEGVFISMALCCPDHGVFGGC